MIPPIANNFVAGESPEAALRHTQSRNDDNIGVILNLLGEHYSDPDLAQSDTTSYVDLVSEISSYDIDACVSVKPSQIGIDISKEVFAENLRQIVDHAHEHNVFVWCDMEDADTTDVTLDTFVELATEYP
jgi:proline dehydrogenase